MTSADETQPCPVSASPTPRAVECEIRLRGVEYVIAVTYDDGRELLVPVMWFPKLASATYVELCAHRITGDGEKIRWEALDEDLSVAGLLCSRCHDS